MKKLINLVKNEVKATVQLLKDVPATIMTLFVLSLVLMNLLANKSISLNVSWLALDTGIVVSWLLFLVMDILVKTFGPKSSTRLTVVAIILNLLIAGLLAIVSVIPGMWGESFVEANGDLINNALDRTIGGTWYILAGSTVAFLTGAIVNNTLNWGVGRLFKNHKKGFLEYATRSYVSTFIAQFVDNLVFALLVSLTFFGWSLLQCFMCALTGAVVELICEVLFSPIGFKVAKKWHEEGIGSEYLREAEPEN